MYKDYAGEWWEGSRITNGRELLANVDGRTAAALRVVALLTSRAKGVYQV
jgi:hypothetical protein